MNMSENAKKIIRICAGLIFVLPYSLTREVGEETRITKIQSLLWEVEIGRKAGLPHFRIHSPHLLPMLLRAADRNEAKGSESK